MSIEDTPLKEFLNHENIVVRATAHALKKDVEDWKQHEHWLSHTREDERLEHQQRELVNDRQ